jgi:hypothetical protein
MNFQAVFCLGVIVIHGILAIMFLNLITKLF